MVRSESDHNHNIIVTVAAANAATSVFCIVVVAAVDVVIAVFPNWALSFHPVSFLSHHNRVIIILLWKRWAMHLNWLCSVLAHSYNVYVCSVRRIHNGTNNTCPEFELRMKREMRADVVMVVCTTPHTLYADHKHLTWFIRIITYLWWMRWCGPTVDAFSHLFSKHIAHTCRAFFIMAVCSLSPIVLLPFIRSLFLVLLDIMLVFSLPDSYQNENHLWKCPLCSCESSM